MPNLKIDSIPKLINPFTHLVCQKNIHYVYNSLTFYHFIDVSDLYSYPIV